MSDAARRVLSGTQCAIGLATVWRPARAVAALTPRSAVAPDPRIVRALGLRQLAQGAVGLARPTAEMTAAGAVVDLLHAASLMPIIVFSRRYRTSATASAALAVAAAAAGAAVSAG